MPDDIHPKLFCHLKNIFRHKDKEDVRETIEDLIEEAGPEGDEAISEHEQLILNNVLDLKDKKCCFAMVPRSDIIAFHKDGTIGDLANLMLAKGHSRIPIYGDSLDDIVGIVHIIDLAKSLLKGNINTPVKDILCRDVHFISPDIEILDLLKDMQSNKIHMSIVIDEYGGVDGLVTIEDLLEEIVGEIVDEYDHEEEEAITQVDEYTYNVDARQSMPDLEGKINCKFDDEDAETVGGFVMEKLGRIPVQGESFEIPQGTFKITETKGNRILKVQIILNR